MATVTVLYPSGPSFDPDYYLKTHMPLVSSVWGKFGLQSWEITSFPEGAPYQVQAILKWESLESALKGLSSSDAEQVFGDIKNFTLAEAVVLTGAITKSEKVA